MRNIILLRVLTHAAVDPIGDHPPENKEEIIKLALQYGKPANVTREELELAFKSTVEQLLIE
jgi:hypothetical protein